MADRKQASDLPWPVFAGDIVGAGNDRQVGEGRGRLTVDEEVNGRGAGFRGDRIDAIAVEFEVETASLIGNGSDRDRLVRRRKRRIILQVLSDKGTHQAYAQRIKMNVIDAANRAERAYWR